MAHANHALHPESSPSAAPQMGFFACAAVIEVPGREA